MSLYYLHKAILDRFQGSAGATLRTDLGQVARATGNQIKMWAVEAAPNVALPCVVFTDPAQATIAGLTTDLDEMFVDFHIYVDDYGLASALLTIAPDLQALYNRVSLSLDGSAKVCFAKRVGNMIPMKDPDGGYQVTVPFRYIVG